MGYKTRSNYAPGYSMTEEQFNNIFSKEVDNESTVINETGYRDYTRYDQRKTLTDSPETTIRN